MCPTPLGRIQTRTATILLPALLSLIPWAITGRPDWTVLIGVYLLLGILLDTCVYAWLLRYQPPWMTFVLALAEFGLIYVLANVLNLDLSPLEAILLYWCAWMVAAATRVVALPIISLTYIESASEFRRAQWSLPPEQAPFPVIAAVSDAGPGGLVRAASGEHAVPLQHVPSPSGLHTVPKVGEAGGRR